MGTSVGPFAALTGLFSGAAEGIQTRHARERQAKLDAEAKAEKDRQYGLERSAASLTRAKTLADIGAKPDTGQLQPGDVEGKDFLSGGPLPMGVGDAAFGSGPYGALLSAFDRTRQQPRTTIVDETGAPTTYRLGIPMAEQRLREKAALDAQKVTNLETQKAEEKKAADVLKKQQDYHRFVLENPDHPAAQQPQNPQTDYGTFANHLEKEREHAVTIAAAKANADAAREAKSGAANWVSAGVDPTSGSPLLLNTHTGETKVGGGVKPVGGASGGAASGTQQGIQARLLGAVAEARTADERMRAYEDKMLANPEKATPGFANQVGGKLATRLAGQHSITGILGETVGEQTTDPEYLQYVRDAGLMARATQLMSSRGGSEAMVSAEQLLNRAVPNPAGLKGSVDAARKSRSAIFGKVGGLMQALTPAQIQKVEAGLDALRKGDAGFDYKGVGALLDTGTPSSPERTVTVNGKTFKVP